MHLWLELEIARLAFFDRHRDRGTACKERAPDLANLQLRHIQDLPRLQMVLNQWLVRLRTSGPRVGLRLGKQTLSPIHCNQLIARATSQIWKLEKHQATNDPPYRWCYSTLRDSTKRLVCDEVSSTKASDGG